MIGVRARVVGDKAVIAALSRVNRQKDNLSEANAKTGSTALSLARSLVPKQTGALARSIRFDTNSTRLTLVAGGPSRMKHGGGVYASIAHFGTYTHRAKGPRPYLQIAAQRVENEAARNMEDQLSRIIRRAGLS